MDKLISQLVQIAVDKMCELHYAIGRKHGQGIITDESLEAMKESKKIFREMMEKLEDETNV